MPCPQDITVISIRLGALVLASMAALMALSCQSTFSAGRVRMAEQASLSGLQRYAPWPKHQANAFNSGVGVGQGAKGKIKWVVRSIERPPGYAGRPSLGPAIAADGTIYIARPGVGVDAINPDGTRKWQYDDPLISSCPCIEAGGTVYFSSGAYPLYALTPDGERKWALDGSIRANDPSSASATVGSFGVIYLASQDGPAAIGPDGKVKWIYRPKGDAPWACVGTPTIGPDGTVYFDAVAHGLIGLDPDGNEKWRNAFVNTEVPPVVDANGDVCAYENAGSYTSLCAFDPNGTRLWTMPAPTAQATDSPALDPDGTIYVTGDALAAIDTHGQVKWTFAKRSPTQPHRFPCSATIAADGTIYCVDSGGDLFALRPDGTKLWEIPAVNTEHVRFAGSPAIGSDGTLYCASRDGVDLIAVK